MECELGDITIHYHMVGSGRPLLFLHGGVGDHQPWRQVIEPLFEHREGWQRIYPDLPGHGHTVAPAWLATEDQMLEVLLRFIDQVLPDIRLVVAGFSWGGYLAQGIVHQRLSEVDGLLLIAPSMHRKVEKNPERTLVVSDEALLVDLDEPLKGIATGLLVVQDRRMIDGVRMLFQSVQSVVPDDATFAARFQWAFSFDVDKLPQPYAKPALFLLGRQNHIVGYRNAWHILEDFPRATFAVLDQAGHGIVAMEQIQASRELIRDWLDRVDDNATA